MKTTLDILLSTGTDLSLDQLDMAGGMLRLPLPLPLPSPFPFPFPFPCPFPFPFPTF